MQNAGPNVSPTASQEIPLTGREANGEVFESAYRLVEVAFRTACQTTSLTAAESIPAAFWLTTALLWERTLRFDPGAPLWPDRDRFVVSSARLLPLRQAFLALTGAASRTTQDFHGLAGALAGQAVASAAGMALAEKILSRRFGHSLVDHRTWLLALPGDLQTGVALETAALAGRFGLSRLTILVALPPGRHEDRLLTGSEDPARLLAAFDMNGWMTRQVAAGDAAAIASAITASQRSRKPSLLLCDGQPHSLTGELPEPPLRWEPGKRRGQSARRAWLRRLSHHARRAEFEQTLAGPLQPGLEDDLQRARTAFTPSGPVESSVLTAGLRGRDILSTLMPEFITLETAGCSPAPDRRKYTSPAGTLTYRCGSREPAMIGLMNGLALHGGLLPCGTAPLHSVDRMRPALRFAALTAQKTICVLVESAPEPAPGIWQQVEQLASLRAMPGLALFRPGTPAEAAAAWNCALTWNAGPVVIVLGRQTATSDMEGNISDEAGGLSSRTGPAQGGYLLGPSAGERDLTLIASGPELSVALEVRTVLENEGKRVAVVSLPCWELFSQQDRAYRDAVLGEAPRIAIEAASGFGWERWLGNGGVFIGRDETGLATDPDALYAGAGIEAATVLDRARQLFRN